MAVVEALRWRGDALELLDQRLLPAQTRYLACRTAADVAQAFVDLALAEKTTPAGITVDGGNIAAAPRRAARHQTNAASGRPRPLPPCGSGEMVALWSSLPAAGPGASRKTSFSRPTAPSQSS